MLNRDLIDGLKPGESVFVINCLWTRIYRVGRTPGGDILVENPESFRGLPIRAQDIDSSNWVQVHPTLSQAQHEFRSHWNDLLLKLFPARSRC
jgi:hypothetical protein